MLSQKRFSNVSKSRSLLRLLNYYEKFLPNLSTILRPPNQFLQSGNHWKWDTRCHSAFKLVKDTLHTAQALMHYNTSSPLKLATDASACHWSHHISCTITKWKKLEKEALAFISHKFTLITDHKPLKTILGPNKGISFLRAARLQM